MLRSLAAASCALALALAGCGGDDDGGGSGSGSDENPVAQVPSGLQEQVGAAQDPKEPSAAAPRWGWPAPSSARARTTASPSA